jgi:predicted secreted protein
MKKNPLLFSAILFLLVFSGLSFSGPAVGAEDSLLKIQVFPDQNSVKSGMMFLVRAQAANSSSGTSTEFWTNSCSYEKHWVADNPAVLIQPWTCNENTLEQTTLEPGDVYEKNIILYISKKDKTGPVTFRLGFKRMSEDGDVAEPLWSDPLTMDVVVPEEMKEAGAPMSPARSLGLDGRSSQAAPAPAAEAVPQAPDQTPAAPVETNGASLDAAPDPAAPEGNQSAMAFEDPGVPIKIFPDEEFSIALASNPSTGFRWKMTLPEEQKIVKLLGSEHVTSQEVMPGVPGEEVFTFRALAPGETKIDFVYERPWEAKTAPTRKIFTVLVQES